jgi:alanine racemase
VLDGLLPGLARLYVEQDLLPALSSLEEVTEWAGHARRAGRPLRAALHVDTGINRLGLSPAHASELSARPDLLARIDIALVMSHLACADEPSHPMNRHQRRLFDKLRSLLPAAPASLANSPGIFLGPEFRYEVVRPGIALYGGNPFLAAPNPMAPVICLSATILQVRDLAPGEAVGYGATWRAERPTRIAVLAVGYRDGFPRVLSEGGAQVWLGGRLVPIVGRISMDLITIDVTDIDPTFARRGAPVELLGDHVTVDDVARWAGTIPYEILTGLGSRYARLYSSAPTQRSRQRKDRP